MSLAAPPRTDELEVSLFGPGVGECVVVHLGAGEWMVVDSCLDPATRKPAALAYLANLGVEPATAITHVVVSHWHDDHTRGISAVLQAAKSAKLVCSNALRREEFKQFIAASQSLNMKAAASSGAAEITAALQIVHDRRNALRSTSSGPTWAQADSLIYRRAGEPSCEVFGLSPSSETLTRGLHDIAELLPRAGMPRRAAVNVAPNETALVLSVRVGGALAVLGSDLETGRSSDSGWAAVLTATARPTAPAHVFKVPHHGSENGYHSGQWSSMLGADAFAIVTPYAAGRKALPTEADITRLKQHTKHVYRTAPHPPKATVDDPVVQRTVGEVARLFRSRGTRMGHVRVRQNTDGTAPRVELFGAAFAE